MENSAHSLNNLFERLEKYTRTSIELYKCYTVYETAALFSILAVKIILGIVVFIITLLLTVAISLWMGDVLGYTAYGFLIMGFVYILIGILLYIFRKPLIKNNVSNTIVKRYKSKE